jgi:hypothetical protein
MRTVIIATLAALLGAALAGNATTKKAAKLLHMIEQVDGAGSGLDADTVRGMAPADFQTGILVVKDSTGATVGMVFASGSQPDNVEIVRNVSGSPVVFDATAEGVRNASPEFVVYTTADCSGTPRITETFLLHAPSRVMLGSAVVVGPTAYYGHGPISDVALVSVENPVGPDGPQACTAAGGVVTARGTCCAPAPNSGGFFSAEAASIDVASLGTPPFHVEGP